MNDVAVHTRQMSMIQAINSAMDVMMQRDPDIVVLGEDVGFFGGVFRATAGLQEKYGKTRVFDTLVKKKRTTSPARARASHRGSPFTSIVLPKRPISACVARSRP